MPEMTHTEQIQAFAKDTASLVERYVQEFYLPLASLVGVLEMVKHELIDRCMYDEGDGN